MKLHFDDIRNFLDHHKVELDVAEFHGLISGLVCAGDCLDEIDDWLPMLLTQDYLSDAQYLPIKHEVQKAYAEIEDSLVSDGFGYQLVLPSDLHSHEERVNSLTAWCSGFVTTLIEYAGIGDESLSGDELEFVADVKTISQTQIEPGDAAEFESVYVEIEEYLRVGVQLVYEHLNPAASPASQNPQEI